MPELDGFETARIVGEMPAGQRPVLVMLGSAGLTSGGHRHNAAIARYVTKPALQSELLEAVLNALGRAAPAKPDAALPVSARPRIPPMDILVVEDHPVNQKLAVTMLQKLGHRPVLAADGNVALDALLTGRFDLVLMDMQMPVMDGLEATRRFRVQEAGQRTPIVAMTANAMEGDRETCLAAGMDDYLSKPLRAPELIAVLERYAPARSFPGSFDYATALAGEDREILEIVAEPFIEGFPKEMATMRNALAAGDLAVLSRCAHSLKGNCGIFGAAPMVKTALIIEKYDPGRDQGLDVNGLIDSLEQEYEILAASLRKLLG
jgi:CheY-like chemotaxis protein/HPt (histidine-containing phosphotransfer) domain-containing protein